MKVLQKPVLVLDKRETLTFDKKNGQVTVSRTGTDFTVTVTTEAYDNWRNGMLPQRALPSLTKDQREFLISGYTQEEWDELFDGEED